MSEPFNVTETSGQDVFGEATVAPGTELRVRVRSGDGVRPSFLKTAETTVDADGQFLVTLSFNDTSPGDSYEVVVDDTGPASELTVEGTVQPVIRTPTTDTPAETSVITSTPTRTATSTPTTTTTSTSTSTSPPATTTTAIPTVQTSTTTPGFGIAAAAVALAAAALLALRRN
jgi:PGF-CTERM protein